MSEKPADQLDSDRSARVVAIVADALARRAQGESVSDDSLIASHPGLMPELEEELLKLRMTAAPTGTATDPSTDQGETVDHRSGGRGSQGLHIRCPHCSNNVELLADTPFENITCATCGSTFNLAEREEQTEFATPLRRVGRFDLVSRVGVGGFGTVWKARDTELDRVVAIKIPRKGQLDSREIEQFYREARSAAQLRHPNIVPVHEVGREEDTLFIVCDLVRGISLSDWLTGQRPHAREVVRICTKVASALHHAHEQGVIHRDLKPSNIMMDQSGDPHLMDFGLAKRDVNEITMTVDGQILGTPAYMSPEQAAGHGHWTDRRTDIYSFGVVLFELLTGEQPFRGNAQMQVHQRLTEDAPDPRKLNRHIPRDLSTITLKCLERDPNRRFSSAQKLIEEFDRFSRGEPIFSRPISRLSRLGRWCRRKPALSIAGALTIVLAIVGPIVAWRIETQRRRLGELVTEKNNLISKVSAEKETSVSQQTRLQQELDIWTGQANPWELWPPKTTKGPRQEMLQKAYQENFEKMNSRLNVDKGMDSEDLATARVGLAMLADSVGQREEAISQYEIAKNIFKDTIEKDPQDLGSIQSLADCEMQLSRLYATDDKEAAKGSLEEASRLYGLLVESTGSKRPKVARMESEMRRAVFSGFSDAASQLEQAALLAREFDDNWPTDPVEFSELISILAGQESGLVSHDTMEDKKSPSPLSSTREPQGEATD